MTLVVDTPDADGTTIRASRELVSQAVANLIDNAIKYAAPSGVPETDVGGTDAPGVSHDPRVVVSVEGTAESVMIRVADNGPGVPEVDRERVLQRFVRLEKSRSETGSGLGLALVAAVVRLLGGHIALGDAAPGLVVTVHLPRGR